MAMRSVMTALILLALEGCIPRSSGQWPSYAPEPASSAQAPTAQTPTAQAPRLETEGGALVALPDPTWKGRPVTAAASQVKAGQYVVQPGETLRGIGNRTGAGSEAIAAANALVAPYIIHPGQSLTIPGGRFHQVAEGETGIAIARAYGVSWSQMVALNGLEEPFILRVGQRLNLPDGTKSSAPAVAHTIEERAAAFNIGIDEIVTGSQPALAEGREASPASSVRSAVPLNVALAEPKGFSGRFGWPVSGKLLSGFGSKGGGRVNDGIDIGAAKGAAVHAAGPGVVAYAGDEIGVFGGLILINHGSGWVTAYGHMERLDVVRGQNVSAGQVIGGVGQTGYVNQPQLHFEIRQDRKPVDPAGYLPARS